MRSLRASSVALSLLGIVYLVNNAIGQPQSQLAQPQVVQDRMMGLGPTAPAPGQGTPLDPSCIPKYVDTLPLPTPMPRSSLQVCHQLRPATRRTPLAACIKASRRIGCCLKTQMHATSRLDHVTCG